MGGQNAPRFIFFIVASFLILFFWNKMFGPKGPPPAAQSVEQVAPGTPQEPQRSTTAPSEPKSEAATTTLVLKGEPTAEISNDKILMRWRMNEGSFLEEIVLKEYQTSASKKEQAQPLTLGGQKQTFFLTFNHPELSAFEKAPFVATQRSADAVTLAQETKKLRLERTIRLTQGYFFDWEIKLHAKDAATRGELGNVTVHLNHRVEEKKTSSVNMDEVAAAVSGKRMSQVFGVKSSEEPLPAPSDMATWAATAGSKVDWVLAGDHYFMQALIPEGQYNPNIHIARTKPDPGAILDAGLSYPLKLESSEQLIQGKGYFGPKSIENISTVPTLKTAIDLGFWRFLAEPILWFLNTIYHKVFANYGVAIIVLTIVVRLLMLPMVHKQMQSMKKLQAVQPEMNRLRERYKDDKQRLNQEMLQFMRTHKVNPLGGCLPLLFQLPIFLALWQALSHTADLFHAPFVGWIYDLSAKDPYYIFPILMAATMLGQQMLMPPSPTMDKTQQRIMLFMPVIFSFFMLNLPSGLNLYMIVSSVFGIAQQLATRAKTTQLVRA